MDIDYVSYFDYERHPLVLPPLRDGVDAQRHRVAIVGGGPIGLALALGLANYGIRSLVLEADDTVCVGSRAACISRRSLEILAQLGAHEAMLAKGLAWTGGRSYYRDVEVFRLQMPHDDYQRFPPMINLQQCFAEQDLVDAAQARSDMIEIRWQTRVTNAIARDDGVTLWAETDQAPYSIDADWVVACDGARSAVRQALGLRFEGTQYEGRYVIIDIELKSDYPTERRAWFDPPSNPGSTLLMHKQPHDIWRLDYQLRDDEDPDEAIKPENVLPRVASHLRMIGERDDWKPVWISMYKANALTLPRYRHGRVLFAGDAAHLVPIFGVRGMNSGIDDAHNLAWKLAFVMDGHAHDALLDTYSDERVFAARENLRYATKSTEFMAPPSHAFALMREAVLSLAAQHEWVRSLINPRQTSAIAFLDSKLNAFAQRSAAFDAGPRPGEVMPECPLTIIDTRGRTPDEASAVASTVASTAAPMVASTAAPMVASTVASMITSTVASTVAPADALNLSAGSRAGFVTELLGPHFTALYFTARGEVPPALAEAFAHLERGPAPFAARVVASTQDHTGRLFPLYGASPGTLYLVRPDGHVMARWREAVPAELIAALDHALGAST